MLDALKMGFMRRQLRRIRGFGHGISDKSSARRHDGLHSLHNAVDFLHGEMFDCSVPNYARKWTVWESLPYVHDLVFNIGTLMEALRRFNSTWIKIDRDDFGREGRVEKVSIPTRAAA